MKDKKPQKKQQGKQNKQKIKEAIPLSLSFGKFDFVYKLEFTEKDLEKPDGKEDDKYYDIESFNSIKDLQFLKDKKNIWDKIQIVPNNSTLEQLMVGNKISKKKMHVEYIAYDRPKFEGDDEFFNEIFNYVNDKNFIDINQKPFNESGNYSFTFEFYFKDKTHSFTLGSGKADKKEGDGEGKKEGGGEEKKEGEGEKNKEGGGEEKKEGGEEKKEEKKEDEDYEENEAMKKGKIPKFSRKDSILCNISPKYTRYCSFYLNYDEIKDIPGDFENRDLIELIFFFKKKGTKIFLNFYRPPEEKEEKKEEDEGNKNKDNEIAGESYDTAGKKKEKVKEKEEKNEEDEEEESKEEKEMKDLNNLYYLTDLYFFDNKQAIEDFDKHYKFFTSDKEKKKINKQKLFDYFIKGIASGTKNEVDGDKMGFFLDEFLKYFIIHAAKKSATKYEFDCQLYPKINHNNMNLVEDYKKIIKKNVNHYISMFITFIIQGVTATGSTSNEVIIGAFLNALEIIKRKLECEKNNIILSEKELMKFKLSEKNLAERIKELALGNKESGFILDCTNKEKSELKEYVPLYDYHLVYYFRSDINKKELQKKGFINEKGFIMYDPVHRKRMRPDLEKKPLNEEEKQKKVEGNIKNIDVGSRIKDKEIDSSKINQDKNMVTNKKLPRSKYGVVKKKEKVKKEKNGNKINEKDISGSGPESSGEEENKDDGKGSAAQSSEEKQS